MNSYWRLAAIPLLSGGYQARVLKKLGSLNRGEANLEMAVMGSPLIFADTLLVLAGFRDGVNGAGYLYQVIHEFEWSLHDQLGC